MTSVQNRTDLEDALKRLVLEREFSQLPYADQPLYFCKLVADTLDVQRVGIWMLNAAEDGLVSTVEWDAKTQAITSQTELSQAQAETYVTAIKTDRLVVVDDAMADPRCKELQDTYLPAFGISSMLDCPLHDMNGLNGVLCAEHVGPKRIWSEQEKEFVLAVSSLISLGFEHRARLEAEQAANQRAHQLTQLAELTVGWLWETDTEFRLSSLVGKNMTEEIGVSGLVGKRPWDDVGLRSIEKDWSHWQDRIAAREIIYGCICSFIAPNGKLRYVEISGRPRFDIDGTYLGYLGISQDVTSRVRRSAELATNEQRYRNASKLANLGHWVWDVATDRASYCSPELAEILGISVEDYLEQRHSTDADLDWVHPDDRDWFEALQQRMEASGEGYDAVVRYRHADGSYRHLHERTEPVFDETGQCVSLVGVVIDVTEQTHMRRDLDLQSNRLANIVDNLPGGVFRVRAEEGWPAVYRSRGYYRQFVDADVEAPEWVEQGSKSAMIVDDADRERVKAVVDASIESGDPYEVEYEVTLTSGETKMVWERGRSIDMGDGRVEIEGIVIDATARHKAEQALIKSQRGEALGQLTGGVAHDFNNLLAAIVGMLELMRDDVDNAEVIEMLDACVGAATRASELTKNMLAFARRAKLAPEVLELNQVVEAANGWVLRTLPSNIEIRTDLAPNIWKIRADASSTESALLNLVINARDAMPDGGQMRIATRNVTLTAGDPLLARDGLCEGHYTVMSVADTGSGISPEVLGKVFEPFFTTKGPGGGSGLGLAMVFGFMKQTGGSVLVDSEEGAGTTFSLYFPAAEAAELKQDEAAQNGFVTSSGPIKILIAEDEDGVRGVLQKVIERAGHEAVAVASGDAAMAAFQEHGDFQMLLTDIVMPGTLTGPALAQGIRQIHPDFPVVFLSGYAPETLTNQGGMTEQDIRLIKPVRRADLLAAVEAALAGGSNPKAP